MEDGKYSGCVTKLNYYMAALMLDFCVSIVVWTVLITLKGADIINMHWGLVLSSIIWVFVCLAFLTVALEMIMRCVRRRKHRCKEDKSIVNEARKSGAWNNPESLTSRALELYLWKNYRIKRRAGELDKDLMERYKKELAQKQEL